MPIVHRYMMASEQLQKRDQNALKKLNLILEDMEIPVRPRNDLRWLILNLHRRNKDHKNYKKAMLLLKYLAQW